MVKEEQVDEYSVCLGALYRWVRNAVECRIEDVKMRRSKK